MSEYRVLFCAKVNQSGLVKFITNAEEEKITQVVGNRAQNLLLYWEANTGLMKSLLISLQMLKFHAHGYRITSRTCPGHGV